MTEQNKQSDTTTSGVSRELMGLIVDEVFDGAVEDASVIEEIYAVIKRHEAARQHDVQPGSFGIEDSRIAYQRAHAAQTKAAGSRPLGEASLPTTSRLSQLEARKSCAASVNDPLRLKGQPPEDDVPAYRFLVEGDLIEATDEFIGNDGQTWARPDGWEVGMEYPSHVFESARRPVNSSRRDHALGSLNADDGLKRELVNQLASVVHDLEHLPVNDTAVQNLFAQHLSGRENGFLVGKIIAEKLGSFGILTESTVLSDMEVVAGHDADSVYNRTSVHAVSSTQAHPSVDRAELLATVKEFARWHHLNELTIYTGGKPSHSEIDFEATAWNTIKRALATAKGQP